MKTREIEKIVLLAIFAFFYFTNISYPIDRKEEMKEYIEKINPILLEIQVAYRNVSQRLLPLEQGAKKTQKYIDNLRALTPPEFMERQHKMILLSFEKLRMGFYLMSRGERPTSITMVRSGADLLKIAVKDILDFSKKEVLIKNDNRDKEITEERIK